ncbi:unnamed protein product [Musa acuminata subsp. burmannicoides]
MRRPLRNDCAAPFLPSAADVADLRDVNLSSRKWGCKR